MIGLLKRVRVLQCVLVGAAVQGAWTPAELAGVTAVAKKKGLAFALGVC